MFVMSMFEVTFFTFDGLYPMYSVCSTLACHSKKQIFTKYIHRLRPVVTVVSQFEAKSAWVKKKKESLNTVTVCWG